MRYHLVNMFVFTPSLRDRLVQSAKDYVTCRVFKKADRDRVNSLLTAVDRFKSVPAKQELALFELNSVVKDYDFKKLCFECDYRKKNYDFFDRFAEILRFTPDVETIEFINVNFSGHSCSKDMMGSLKSLKSVRIVDGYVHSSLLELLRDVPLELLEFDLTYWILIHDIYSVVIAIISANLTIRSLRVLLSGEDDEKWSGMPCNLEETLRALLKNTHLEVSLFD